jgi:hypothetical protein
MFLKGIKKRGEIFFCFLKVIDEKKEQDPEPDLQPDPLVKRSEDRLGSGTLGKTEGTSL